MTEEKEEKAPAFKVEDRRRFSSEGDVRPEIQERAQPANQTSTQKSEPQGGATARVEAGRDASPAAEVNFAAFIVSLSTQALMLLGEINDPAAQVPKDLDGAQQIIDILGMLRDKTRGNLDRNEEGLLESILYDLRLKYVEIARQPAR